MWLRSENMLNGKQEKKPRDHTAVLLSSSVRIWPRTTGKGTFSDWLGWDGSWPKLLWTAVLLNPPWGCFSFLYSYLWEATALSYWYEPTNQNIGSLSRGTVTTKRTLGGDSGDPQIPAPHHHHQNSLWVMLLTKAFRALTFFFYL